MSVRLRLVLIKASMVLTHSPTAIVSMKVETSITGSKKEVEEWLIKFCL
jgi:hypothetical protein